MKPFYRQNHEIVHIKMTVDFKGFSVKINRFLEKTIRIIFLRFYREEMSENCECVCREHFLTQKWHSDKKDFRRFKKDPEKMVSEKICLSGVGNRCTVYRMV